MNRSFGEHPGLEELDVAILVARDFAILSGGRDVDFCLPASEHLQRLVLDHVARHPIPFGPGLDDLVGLLPDTNHPTLLKANIKYPKNILLCSDQQPLASSSDPGEAARIPEHRWPLP